MPICAPDGDRDSPSPKTTFVAMVRHFVKQIRSDVFKLLCYRMTVFNRDPIHLGAHDRYFYNTPTYV